MASPASSFVRRFIDPDHFSAGESAAIVRDTLALYPRLEEAAAGAGRVEKAHIPQPEFVRSARHNLASEERYTRVVLDDAGGRKLSCEYFPRYGEDGHALAYFRGNQNLPGYIGDKLVASVRRTMEATGLVQQREALFQITRGEAITDLQLPVGSLLVLSGESRYEWKHRVLPMAASGSAGPGGIERVSPVLGFR